MPCTVMTAGSVVIGVQAVVSARAGTAPNSRTDARGATTRHEVTRITVPPSPIRASQPMTAAQAYGKKARRTKCKLQSANCKVRAELYNLLCTLHFAICTLKCARHALVVRGLVSR